MPTGDTVTSLDLTSLDLTGPEHTAPDDERVVEFVDDAPVLPDQTADDTDAGWGESYDANDSRILDERPPHWD